MSISRTLKIAARRTGEFLRQSSNAIRYLNGPVRCDTAANIARDWDGSHEEIRPQTSAEFPLPTMSRPELEKFFGKLRLQHIPAVSITRIPGGRAYAGGVVLSPDGSTIARDLSIDLGAPFAEHFLCGRRIHPPLSLRGNTLCAALLGGGGYYHWLLEELPRMLLMAAEIDSFDQLLCSRDSAANRTALAMLGAKDLPIIYTHKASGLRKHYRSEMLTCPSMVAPTGEPSPMLVELLTRFVAPLLTSSTRSPARIFVTRDQAKGRRLAAEEQIFPAFEVAGYVRVRLEQLSWPDQINLFHHAREICAPHGAGLANLVFCAQRPQVVEIFNSRYVHWCFWKLSHLVGARYLPLAFPKGEVGHHPSDCMMDIASGDQDRLKILETTGLLP